jgi:AraC-like DNA-binding protein
MEKAGENIRFVIFKQSLENVLSLLLNSYKDSLNIFFPLPLQGGASSIVLLDAKPPSSGLQDIFCTSNSQVAGYFLQIDKNYILRSKYLLVHYIKGQAILSCRENDKTLLFKVLKKIYHAAAKEKGHALQRFYLEVFLQIIGEMLGSYTAFKDREELLAKDFLQLLKTEIFPKHQVSYYAEQLFVSRRYLTHAVHKFHGENPKALIDKYIMYKAKELLATRDTLYNIAEKLEFSSPASFTTFFKKHAGCTPSCYRIQFNKK